MGNALQKNEERRSYRRVSDAIALRISTNDAANSPEFELDDLPDYPTHVVSLSPNGLKCYHPEPFEDGSLLLLKMRLFPEQSCIEVQAEVVNSGEDRSRSRNDCFFAGLAFRHVPEEVRETLLAHIDLVAKQSFGGSVKLVK